jgi:hypothetical protein
MIHIEAQKDDNYPLEITFADRGDKAMIDAIYELIIVLRRGGFRVKVTKDAWLKMDA